VSTARISERVGVLADLVPLRRLIYAHASQRMVALPIVDIYEQCVDHTGVPAREWFRNWPVDKAALDIAAWKAGR
jgi:hypothetical protein